MPTKFAAKKIAHLLKETVIEFVANNALRLSAALSCYILFSLIPLLFIIISLCGLFFGEQAVRGEVFDQINELVGTRAATEIQQIIKTVKLSKDTSIASVIGVVFSVIAASGVFAEIQASINFIWGIKEKPKRGIMKWITHRLVAFTAIGFTGLILMVGLVVNSLINVLENRLILYLPGFDINFYYMVNLLILFFLLIILFTAVFKILNDGKPVLRDCLTGAIFTAVLFMIVKFAIGTYFDHLAGSSIYGAVGTLLVILTWIYYSAIIFYLGVAFTNIYANTFGKGIKPNKHSVLMEK
jgi:membrane protein